jgi:hypothetical protein
VVRSDGLKTDRFGFHKVGSMGLVKTKQVRWGHFRKGQVRFGWVKYFQVSWYQMNSNQIGPDRAR